MGRVLKGGTARQELKVSAWFSAVCGEEDARAEAVLAATPISSRMPCNHCVWVMSCCVSGKPWIHTRTASRSAKSANTLLMAQQKIKGGFVFAAKQSEAKQGKCQARMIPAERARRERGVQCTQAEVAQPVGLQQHRRWRSAAGTASQVEDTPLYCIPLATEGRTTDGLSDSGKEQKLVFTRAWETELWPAWERAYLNSILVVTACCEATWQTED